jgi:hypothetical protein
VEPKAEIRNLLLVEITERSSMRAVPMYVCVPLPTSPSNLPH